MWVRSPSPEDLLEEGVTTHSRVLAWRTPWTEKPGGLQSKGHKESDTTDHTQGRPESHVHFHQRYKI